MTYIIYCAFVAELHEKITFLMGELSYWETKLLSLTQKAQEKLKKEMEEYKEFDDVSREVPLRSTILLEGLIACILSFPTVLAIFSNSGNQY